MIGVTYAVELRLRAYDDIRRNVGWLAQHVSHRSAARWHAAIYASVNSLTHNPERCPAADEAAELGFDLRVLYHGRRPHVFRILFTIDGQTVNVYRVMHAAQDQLTAVDI